MSLKKYKKVKYLGKGSYGAAILVHLRSNKSETFVIKEIVIGHMKEEERVSTMNEVEVLRQMHHSNIAMYVESFIEGSRLYIVMEHADGGDLSGAITRRKEGGKPWPENEIMRMFVQICLALKHVHEQNILHRDLKSQNIFLTSKGIVKLGDFGIAKVLDGTDAQARTQIGTPYYLSPEICESKPYGRSSDMWSMGVVLYELMALELPFTAQSLPALVIKICTADPKWEKLEDTFSTSNIELCQSLLLKDCNARPTVRDLLKSDYLMVHISKLLSHTIKMGKGGAEGAVLGGTNVDEVDRNIERERTRQKANEKAEKEKERLASRHAQHEEERDKLRKYKQDKARLIKQKEKELEDVVYVPTEKVGTLKPSAAEKTQRDVDQALAQAARREEMRLKEQQEQYERMLHEQQMKHQEEMRRNMSTQRLDDKDKDRASVAQPPRSRPGSGNGNGGVGRSSSRPGSGDNRHESYQQQGHNREDYRDARNRSDSSSQYSQRSQQDGYMVVAKQRDSRGKSSEEGGEEMSAARREFFANRAAAQQIKAKVEAYERGGSSRASRHGNSSSMQVALSDGSGQQPSHPSKEYRHQARRQHGQDLSENRSQLDDGRYLSGEERIAQVKAQRKREQELESAEKERQLQLAYEETRKERLRIEALRKSNAESPARENRGGGDFDVDSTGDEHEQSISHYERQRRRELQKEEENRKHEKLLREARSRTRHPRKSKEGAVAFSIDFNDDSVGRIEPTVESSDRPRSNKKLNKESVTEPSEQFRSRSNSEISESDGSVSTTTRQRKSWGAPIAPPRRKKMEFDSDTDDANEVPDGTVIRQLYGTSAAQEVEEDEEAVLKCLEARNGREEAARGHAKEVFRKLREQKRREAKLSLSKANNPPERRRSDPRPPTRPPPNKSVDTTPPRIPRKKSNTRLHDPPSNDEVPSQTNEKDILMKKPSGSDKKLELEQNDGSDGKFRSKQSSSASNLARLNDVMGQVARAQEEVSKVIADARENNGVRGSRGSRESFEKELNVPSTPPRDKDGEYSTGRSTSSTQKTTVRNCYGRTGQRLSLGDDEIFAYSSGDDTEDDENHERELEKTLDSWLTKETIKSKKSEQNLLKSMKKEGSMKHLKRDDATDYHLSMSSAAKEFNSKSNAELKVSPRLEMKSEASVKEVQRSKDIVEEDNDAGNDNVDYDEVEEDDNDIEDGEVAGLQCLLAKALLSADENNAKHNEKGGRDDISL